MEEKGGNLKREMVSVGDPEFSFYIARKTNEDDMTRTKRRLHSIIAECNLDRLIQFFQELDPALRPGVHSLISHVDDTSSVQHALYRGWIEGLEILVQNGAHGCVDGYMFVDAVVLALQQSSEEMVCKALKLLLDNGWILSERLFHTIQSCQGFDQVKDLANRYKSLG